jgi:transcriptional regulator with XRE-family HTH domain
MAGKAREPGPSSQRTAANLRRIRREGDLTTAALSRRLAEIGHPVADTGITKIEKGDRRVDVDDLVALAVALDTTPNQLLLPEMDVSHPSAKLDLTPRDTQVRLDDAWAWASGERPLSRAPEPDVPPAVVMSGVLPPDIRAAAAPDATWILLRLRDLAVQGIAEPSGAQIFQDGDGSYLAGFTTRDADRWDRNKTDLPEDELAWLIAGLRAREAAAAAEEERGTYDASA